MKRVLPLLLLTAACSVLPGTGGDPLTLAVSGAELRGLVVDVAGTPLAGAEVRSDLGTTVTGDDGTFVLEAPGSPSWVRVRADGHLPRTEAAAPGRPLLSRLTPQDGGTVSLRFGGDVMAGRRFYDRDEDGRTSDALLREGDGVAAHRALLEDVRPLLEEPDVMVVNLESPLHEDPVFAAGGPRPAHFQATKEFVFASAPALAEALKDVGVDVVDLAGDHLQDVAADGVRRTVDALDDAQVRHHGAGADQDAAWAPARVEARGQRFSFLSCTTATAADGAMPIAGPGQPGVAQCDEQRLTQVVAAEAASGSTVVVSVHGGREYQRVQRGRERELADAARAAGARIVVGRHPHVVGPVRTDRGDLTADSLGSLLYDQSVRSTFPSYLLSADVRAGRIVRARTEPLVLQDYTPRGAVGALADVSDRFAADLRGASGTYGPGGVEVVPGGPVREGRATAGLRPLEVRRLSPGWSATGRSSRGVQLGEELLWTGGFEDDETGGSLGGGLWDLSGGAVSLQPDATHTGAQGIRMVATSAATAPALLTPRQRTTLPYGVQPVTFQGWVRGSAAVGLTAELHWYGDTKGPSSAVLARPVRVAAGWTLFRIEATPPPGTAAAQVYLRLLPAAGDADLRVAVDDLQLVQWAPDGTPATPVHGVVRARDAARTQTFVARLPAGGEKLPDWVSGAPLLAP